MFMLCSFLLKTKKPTKIRERKHQQTACRIHVLLERKSSRCLASRESRKDEEGLNRDLSDPCVVSLSEFTKFILSVTV